VSHRSVNGKRNRHAVVWYVILNLDRCFDMDFKSLFGLQKKNEHEVLPTPIVEQLPSKEEIQKQEHFLEEKLALAKAYNKEDGFKLIRITHHLPIMDDLPAFGLLMSDGKEYLSHRGMFNENTKSGQFYLRERHRESRDNHLTEQELNQLLKSEGLANEDLIDGSGMFSMYPQETGRKSLTEAPVFPNLEKASQMYAGNYQLTEPAKCPNLKRGYSMYYQSGVSSAGNYPQLEIGRNMYGSTPYERDAPFKNERGLGHHNNVLKFMQNQNEKQTSVDIKDCGHDASSEPSFG